MAKDTLESRMKEFYEHRSRYYLPNKMPVIIRLDGRSFRTYTKGLHKPFDSNFSRAMQQTALELVNNISNCKLAYVQSDEISLLLTDYHEAKTQSWFTNNLQKLVSVSASMATAYFNYYFQEQLSLWFKAYTIVKQNMEVSEEDRTYYQALVQKRPFATFDSRAFVLPQDEVNNYFIWRQNDAIRNSILACGQTYIGKKDIHGLKLDEIKAKLKEIDHDWDELSITKQQGSSVVYVPQEFTTSQGKIIKVKPYLNNFTPLFAEMPEYVNNIVYNVQYDIQYNSQDTEIMQPDIVTEDISESAEND